MKYFLSGSREKGARNYELIFYRIVSNMTAGEEGTFEFMQSVLIKKGNITECDH